MLRLRSLFLFLFLFISTIAVFSEKIIVSCVGDSITYGSGASNRNETAYPAVLQKVLGTEKYDVRNYGLGSTTMMKSSAHNNHSYWNSNEFKEAISSNPDIVVIQLGTNDAKQWIWDEKNFTHDYITMIHLFRMLPSNPVIYISISPPMYRNGSGIRMDIVNSILPSLITRISEATGSRLINIFNVLGGKNLSKPEDYFVPGREWKWNHGNDGIHPNDKGYVEMANEIASVILKTYDDIHLRHQHQPRRRIISCVGDSLTQGWGASDMSKTSYPAVLQRLLGSEKFDVRNFGVEGAAMLRQSNHSYWKSIEMKKSLASTPDIVVIQLGTNDANVNEWNESNFTRDYISMIYMFQNLTSDPSIYISIPPPVFRSAWGISKEIVNERLPEVIFRISELTNAHLIRVFDAIGGKYLLKPEDFRPTAAGGDFKWPHDGIHLTDKGYFDMAQEVAMSIHKTINHHHRLKKALHVRSLRTS